MVLHNIAHKDEVAKEIEWMTKIKEHCGAQAIKHMVLAMLKKDSIIEDQNYMALFIMLGRLMNIS